MRAQEEIIKKIESLENDEKTFTQFLRDTYNDKECSRKIESHLWRIRREIEILNWVLNYELPF